MSENQSDDGKPTVIDLFCGCGGFSTGFEQAGFNVLGGFDHNEKAVMTWNENHDGEGYVTDLTDMSGGEVMLELGRNASEVDGIVGGPPCKDFSLANWKSDGGRNNLVKSYIDIVVDIDPEFVVMENVPQLAADRHSEYFDYVTSQLEDAGYYVSSRVVNAKNYGVPQKRERLIVIATKTHPIPLTIPVTETPTVGEALEGLPPLKAGESGSIPNHVATNHSDKKVEQIAATDTGERLNEKYKQYIRLDANDVSPTIVANSWTHAHPEQDRLLTHREQARIQTFPDTFVFPANKTANYRLIGNAVPVELARSVGRHIMYYLYE